MVDGRPQLTRPPYETGEVYTSGACPGEGFECTQILMLGEFQCLGLHKWIKRIEEDQNGSENSPEGPAER